LEDLRNKFVETVGNLEEAKRISEERQKQVSALQFEFVELKKQFNEETSILSNKLIDRERQMKILKGEFEALKTNYENSKDEMGRDLHGAMLKVKETEEQKAFLDKILEEARHKAELWKMESAKKDEEIRKIIEQKEQYRIEIEAVKYESEKTKKLLEQVKQRMKSWKKD
ncbi:MAG: hypothetical protein HY746_09905, partial [Elusimicrobia bacterium]|nr:hypothetical protein [Elusimicrobiota bacterium]